MANSTIVKKMASKILKCGVNAVRLNMNKENSAKLIEQAVTRELVRGLIRLGIVRKVQKKGVSRARANKTREQKDKGHRKGPGSRKGSRKAYERKAKVYPTRVRAVRDELRKIRGEGECSTEEYRYHYRRSSAKVYSSRAKTRRVVELIHSKIKQNKKQRNTQE